MPSRRREARVGILHSTVLLFLSLLGAQMMTRCTESVAAGIVNVMPLAVCATSTRAPSASTEEPSTFAPKSGNASTRSGH